MAKNNRFNARMLIIFFGIVISIAIIISGCTKNTPNTPKDEPLDLSCPDCNVIFLNIELLRADYVGLISNEYGNNTPNIDKFFENSIIFEDASAPSGATIVSNIAVLTGIDPSVIHKIVEERYDTGYRPPADRPFLRNYSINYFSTYLTIAQRLYAKNYTTININDGGHTGQYTFMDAGFDKYYETTNIYLPNGVELNTTFIILQREIQSLKHNTDTDTSAFFLLVHSNLLHALPYTYPINRQRIINPKVISIPFPEKGEQLLFLNFSLDRNTPISFQDKSFWMWKYDNSLAYNNIRSFDNTTYATYQKISHQLYAEQVQYVDEELGNIFADLENGNLLNNTIIVLYANHGDGLFDNSIPNHDTSYQSSIHVPLFIRHPKIKQQLRIKTPTALIDLTPTIIAMISTNNTGTLNMTHQGLIPIILNNTYIRQRLFGVSNSDKYIRYQDMKLIIFNDNRKELYNITADPHELNNIAAAYPETVKELSDALTEHEIAMRKEFQKQYGNST